MKKNKKKSIVVLSGGLDSAANLSIAASKRNVIQTITFDYGQKAAKAEINAAKKLSSHYKIPHTTIKLDWLKKITTTSLVNKKKNIPQIKDSDFKDKSKDFNKTAKAVWVPNRNGSFINIAAAFAESLKADTIILGFNKEESETFPDNSKEFMDAINESLEFSTLRNIKLECFTINMMKPDILKKAVKAKCPLEYIYSCYTGKKTMCGNCESCQRTIHAAKAIGIWEKIKHRFKKQKNIGTKK